MESVPQHGGQPQYISESFGIPSSQLVDFSASINPEGPPPGVLAALRARLDDLSILTAYPDLQQTELKQGLAQYAGVSANQIAVGNGFVPLLEAALRTLPIHRCLLPVPAFIEYRKALARARIEVTTCVLTPESNFNYDLETKLPGNDAVLLANPQNPSGVCCSLETLVRLTARAAEQDIYVLLDEAFIDYLPEHSLTPYINRFPNLIVFRSVTKFHGIPGLRVAYAVANAAATRALNENLAPWPITTLASHAIIAALEDQPYAVRTRLLNRHRRADLQTRFQEIGIHTYSSAANFLLLRLPSPIDAVAFWQRMIVEHHIVLRSCINYENLVPGHLRAAVRHECENVRLVEAAHATLLSGS